MRRPCVLFVPNAGGITHNPKEYATKQQVALSAEVLLDPVLELAGTRSWRLVRGLPLFAW